jgi:hypothetical protein
MPDEDGMHVHDQQGQARAHRRGASSDDSMRARSLTILLLVALGIFVVLMYLLIR